MDYNQFQWIHDSNSMISFEPGENGISKICIATRNILTKGYDLFNTIDIHREKIEAVNRVLRWLTYEDWLVKE